MVVSIFDDKRINPRKSAIGSCHSIEIKGLPREARFFCFSTNRIRSLVSFFLIPDVVCSF